ncbi:A/G-specific adenine glycosylase [Aquimarina sp. BL5]|uniref:A/G-specific adenine glycosylase n=1 Tax=Aquimarina sp. BL5 TaxID=1714860 RepID=UPI000E54F87D|nr:A/G-specific adenine glycosylase [Aquimarina sp. BL5]AXT52260.1 A/G-specific adenine glycosylase [Aquimarina sp. BL5]RKN09932.1 A/G-specific adenine glycosylase [Aquimarina sp. BL5]
MIFSKKLISWYLENKRSMPWRETTDPYRIWLSEIILQQTRVAQGLPYYLSFTDQYPTVFDLANAEEEQVLKLWQGLGYYSRARNLHTTAKYVANDLNGVFPSTYKDLLKLKGVGDYTASAIASICYNEAVPVVDGNVYRVLARYFNIDTPINSTQGIKEFKKIAFEFIDPEQPATYNQAIMEFGALQCKPQSPYCIVCPFNDSCESLKKGTVASLPVKLKKLKVKKRYFNYLIFSIKNQQTIIRQRIGKGIWQNLYEFPLIESDNDVDLTYIKDHDIFKNLMNAKSYDITLYKDEFKIHKLSHQHLYTRFYIVKMDEKPEMNGELDLVEIEKIREYPVPILLGNFIDSFF